jgi:hypothetical protein
VPGAAGSGAAGLDEGRRHRSAACMAQAAAVAGLRRVVQAR